MNKDIYLKVAKEVNLPEDVVENIYKAYWLFIKNYIRSLPLNECNSIEELSKLRTSISIPSLGKLYCSPSIIIKRENKLNNNENNKD